MKVISAIVVVFCVHVANTSWADELSNIDDAFSFIERSSDKSAALYHSIISGNLNQSDAATLSAIENISTDPNVQLPDMVVASLGLQFLSANITNGTSPLLLEDISDLYEKAKANFMSDRLQLRNFLSCTLYGNKKVKYTLKALDTLVDANDEYFNQVHMRHFRETDQLTQSLAAQMYGMVTRETVFMAKTYRAILNFHKRYPESVLDERIDVALLLRNLAVGYNQMRAQSLELSTKRLIKQLENEGVIPAASLRNRVYSYIEIEHIPWLVSTSTRL
ncbi:MULTISPECIES: hypothetical protein [Alteromonas]|uniref:hypothetical protein n=1 Tax=Alteromonas TaxID=226 RepID=UPI00128872A0|nr:MULTISPECIES: hypothetical protein [Alteromonas]CAI2390329.1 hypothetical protein ALT831_02300 [Alteromonas macleodii]CAI3959669.1 hypothetical protein ALTBGP9_02230 [Alteromonas macleodii]CAI3960570.1 hypothetical protein ALTBGP14_02300 [Alteromonas macleodii]CAI3960576.1 hypothetical protein ALTBGP6_02300 [Alteromonas macleodii]VTO39925.1 hypothetical protein ALTBGP6_02300 [Alteromonas macleodii]|tara:strand:- start:469 stop:1299 length:831 start_codon:yes stop_codon:yes gene_type:complete